MRFIRFARLMASILILAGLILAGCGKSRQSSTDAGANVQIALQQPQAGTLVVVLTGADGAPITDAAVALEGNMNHAGMSPVLVDAVVDQADGNPDGHYSLPFAFTMLGDWVITVNVARADGRSFSRDISLQDGDNGIVGDSGQSAGSSVGEEGKAAILVENPVASPAPLAGGTGAVYLVLHNEGDAPVRWIGADSPAAGAIELHSMENDNGVMRMRQMADGIEVGPNQAVSLISGEMHLMLTNLVKPLEVGDMLQVTLHFDGIDDITVAIPVVSMDKIPR